MTPLQTLVAAVLSVPWTILGVRLYGWSTSMGTSPTLRKVIYAVAAGLQALAIYGAVTA